MPWMALLVKYIRKPATAAARLPRASASPRMEVPSFSVPTGVMSQRCRLPRCPRWSGLTKAGEGSGGVDVWCQGERDRPDGDPSERVPHKVFGHHFGDVEPDDRSLTQLRPSSTISSSWAIECSGRAPLPAAVSFVTTEHFTLQVARSSAIAEVTGRASTFLGAMSGGLSSDRLYTSTTPSPRASKPRT
jgi:hypothetical protein